MATQAETTAISPFDRIGGIAALRAMHAADLAPMRASLPSFLAGWSGGPRDWWEANPGKCMMSMHAPLAIDRETARQWAEAMRRAIADAAPADLDIAAALADTLSQMALGMAKG